MAITKNTGITKMPTALTDPASVFNALADKYESGRTILCLACGTVIKGHAVTIQTDGTYRHAEPGETFCGVAAGNAANGAQFFAVCDIGVEITLDYASFTAGGSVYVGTGGELVQTFSGCSRIGVATAADKVVLLASGLMDLNDFEGILSASLTIQLMQESVSARVKTADLTELVNAVLIGHGLITES